MSPPLDTPEAPEWRTLTEGSPIPFRYKLNHVHRTWAKTHFARPELYLQPENVPEIQQIVNTARQCRKKLITVGSGHSPGEITVPGAPADTWIINLDNFNRVLGEEEAMDEDGKRRLLITVEVGIRLHQLASALAERGWSMPNLGSIWEQSLAGAIATATHGSSIHHGLLSENVQRLTIMLSDGKSYECSHDKNPELFQAALVSLGALGIITHITYSAVSAYRISWQQEIMKLPTMLSLWENGLWTEKEYSRVWWFPYSERTVVWRAEKVAKKEWFDEETKQWNGEFVGANAELSQPPYSWYGSKMGYHAYQLMLYAAMWVPWITPYVERFVFRTQYGWNEEVIGKATQNGEQALLMDCLFSQYVNEWAIPLKDGPEAISRFQAWILGAPIEKHGIPLENTGIYTHAPIEVRVTDSSISHSTNTTCRTRALLDTSCPEGPTLYLNATFYRPYLNMGDKDMRRRYYRAFEWLMLQYGGRPHWAKNFLVGGGGEEDIQGKAKETQPEGFLEHTLYPWMDMYGASLRRWRAVRRTVDPEGVFKSKWAERTVLKGEEGDGSGMGESTVFVGEEELLEFVSIEE